MNKRYSVTCPKCSGSGQYSIEGILLLTLWKIGGRKRITAPELRKLMGKWDDLKSETTYNNRLERLTKLGFLTRGSDGGRPFYSPVLKPQPQTKVKI